MMMMMMMTKIAVAVPFLLLLVSGGIVPIIHAQSTSASSSSSSSSSSYTQRLYLKFNRLPAAIPNSISDHTANLISNRFVYLAGGCNATLGNLYNPSLDSFQCGSITNHFYRYDIVTDVFATLPAMPVARYRHVAAAVNNDQIWIFGGRDVNDNIIPQVDVFEIALNRWINVGNISHDLLSSDQGSFSHGNYAYVAGGYYQNYTAHNQVLRINTLSTLSTKTLQVDLVASLHEARGDVAYTYDDTYAYVVGGFTNVNNFCSPLGATERYTFATNTWESLSPLENPRSDLVVAQINHTLFAIGGERQLPNICNITGTPPAPGERTIAVDNVEVYDETLSQWNVIASLPEHRFRFAAVVYKTGIYTFGGQFAFNATCNCYRTSREVVQYLDKLTNVTTTTTPPPMSGGNSANGMSGATTTTLGSSFVCVGLLVTMFMSYLGMFL